MNQKKPIKVYPIPLSSNSSLCLSAIANERTELKKTKRNKFGW